MGADSVGLDLPADERLPRPPGRTPARRRQLAIALLLLPAAGLLVFGLLVPSAFLFIRSFLESIGYGQVANHFTFESYTKAFGSSVYRQVTYNALGVGALTAIISTAASYPVAYFLTFRVQRARNLILFLIVASLFSSYLVRVYAWRTILGQNGVINDLLQRLGIIHDPLLFLLFSRWAVLLTLTNIFLPFTILILTASMQNVPRDLLENARDLGASPLRSFSRVLLPLTMTGAIGALVYTFILAASDYITPQLVGGTNGVQIGTVVADQFIQAGNQPLGAAVSFTLLAIFALVYVALRRLERFKGI
jgi:spermidine/putrescine transport system permease protein